MIIRKMPSIDLIEGIFNLYNDYKKMPSIDLMVHVAYSHLQGLSFRKIEITFDIPKTTAQRWNANCSILKIQMTPIKLLR